MSYIGGHKFEFKFELDDPSNFRRNFRSPIFQTKCACPTSWVVYCSFFPIKTPPKRLHMYFKLQRTDTEVTVAHTTMEIEFWDKDDESFYYAYFSLPVYSIHNPILKGVPISSMTVGLPYHKLKSLTEKKLSCTIYFNIDDKCVPVAYSPLTDTCKTETPQDCKTETPQDCKTETPQDCKTETARTETPQDCKTGKRNSARL
ncbi:hypothetical protein CDAR_106561 [Caerostris darwini]|uniref:Uncharacterized protein n=1 Tax=Caerostris darwini TaxID=1538125 RepID=A0AAV4Q2C4_9ARAC|nr:hypothetical protein CDAR_106561 [Caerostris darwini]